MIIFPAIDLRAGQVVRLRQGRPDEQITYSNNPTDVAMRWQSEGAEWLHIVDLDSALDDPQPINMLALREILRAVSIPIQFGGGMRDRSDINRAFESGVARIVVGTMAVEEPEKIIEIVDEFGSDRIVLGLDMKDGRAASRGWKQITGLQGVELGKMMFGLGIRRAVVTDILRDGMLSGIDAGKLANAARETGLKVIASGGISSLQDLRNLAKFESAGIEGAIIGQALYSGELSMGEAIRESRTC